MKRNMSHASLWDILFLLFLGSVTIYFLTINSGSFISNDLTGAFTVALTLILIFTCWSYFLSSFNEPISALKFARLSLTPFLILLILIPYSFFYGHLEGPEPLGCLGVILIGCFIFNRILKDDFNCTKPLSSCIPFLLVIYAIYFSVIAVLRHLNYQNASSFDVAIYSQLQWNNIHGLFFQTSFSGSNFVTHNSPFLILLSPFYAIYPHPENLLVLKTLCLTFSAVPFYLILKHYLNEKAIFPLMLGYLFFPFIVGQHFNAPHETCFLPPLLLFSFYFFIKNRFKSFLLFLFLSLTVKEHLAFISIMFGLYSFYLKKEKHWFIVPLFLGIAWALFSMWVIYHFQKIYHVDPYPAWLIDNIKQRFLRPDHPLLSNVIWGIQTSNLGHWSNFTNFYLLLSPVCLYLPFFSSIWILGLPELMINFLAPVPLSYPTWHYNIVSAIFLLIACVSSIKKTSSGIFLKSLGFPCDKAQELLSWFLCICILSHFFLWGEYINFKIDPRYVNTMNAAISMVPLDSSVSLTKHLVAYVSDRKDYFLCEDKRKGDYLVLDKGEKMTNCIQDSSQTGHYAEIFNQNDIRVYKIMPSHLSPN